MYDCNSLKRHVHRQRLENEQNRKQRYSGSGITDAFALKIIQRECFSSEEKKFTFLYPSPTPHFTFFNKLYTDNVATIGNGARTSADKQLKAFPLSLKGSHHHRFPSRNKHNYHYSDKKGRIKGRTIFTGFQKQPYLITITNILRNNVCNRPCIKTPRISPF